MDESNDDSKKEALKETIMSANIDADILEETEKWLGTQEEQQEKLQKQQEKPIEVPKSETAEPAKEGNGHNGILEWFNKMGWHTNPFIFNINPSLFVGYKSQTERITIALQEHQKFMLILGPTGSGKTTLLKWLSSRLKNYDVLYIGKPPHSPEEFVHIFSNKYRKPWYAFWARTIKNIYEIPDFLSNKLHKRHLVVMVDEVHEANLDVLKWLRVLTDQVENMSIILSGLSHFEDQLRNNLETFTKRFTARIELLSLTKEETKQLINKRIMNVGGRGNEFSDSLIDSIYEYTAGFPREIIRVCGELVNNTMLKGRTQIEFDLHEKSRESIESRPASATIIDKMTPMQKEILELISQKPMTPGQIANSMHLEKYKSRQHAVRSVNNIMKALHESGYLERRKDDKAYIYSLSPRISTLFVKR